MDDKRYDVEAVKQRLTEYLENERDIDNQIERHSEVNDFFHSIQNIYLW